MNDKIENKENITTHKKSSKIILAIMVAGAFVLALSIVISIVLLFFPVNDFEVTGDSRYDYAQIIDASGIKHGARLYYVNESKAEKRILQQMPYLESVKVTSYFPNRVKIEIKEFEDIFLTRHERGFCYVNGDFEVLEIVETAPSYDKFMGIFVKLEGVISGEIGTVYQGDDAERAKELVILLKEYGFYEYLDIVDVEDKYSNSFTVSKKIVFVLGSMTDIGEKIDVSFKVCFSDNFKRNENYVIDSTDKKRVVLRYISDDNIREEYDFCENQ